MRFDGASTIPTSTISMPVLVIADLFHPVDVLAVNRFLDRDVNDRRGWRRTVPMLEAGRKPHHVSGADLLNSSTFTLHPAETGGDDQGLSERVGVPRRPGTGLEGNAAGSHASWFGRLEERIDPDRAGGPFRQAPCGMAANLSA